MRYYNYIYQRRLASSLDEIISSIIAAALGVTRARALAAMEFGRQLVNCSVSRESVDACLLRARESVRAISAKSQALSPMRGFFQRSSSVRANERLRTRIISKRGDAISSSARMLLSVVLLYRHAETRMLLLPFSFIPRLLGNALLDSSRIRGVQRAAI